MVLFTAIKLDGFSVALLAVLGVDFDETFSPVVSRPLSALFSIWLSPTTGMFINLTSRMQSSMELYPRLCFALGPTGFVDAAHPNHTTGFCEAMSDTSLFIYGRDSGTAYLLLYVDDIVPTASSASLLRFLPNEGSWSVATLLGHCCYTLFVRDVTLTALICSRPTRADRHDSLASHAPLPWTLGPNSGLPWLTPPCIGVWLEPSNI
ncbi:hypothetical protein U9M48_002163 [Paspalum notatum var. saurae]|uniref:Reverse transcriptase Ty1/copia-type domain-containing protein n=1 Tax=Paspalum notatum var. saurae TaxID=547442 RepID=A0AAQ3PFP5_PASNO